MAEFPDLPVVGTRVYVSTLGTADPATPYSYIKKYGTLLDEQTEEYESTVIDQMDLDDPSKPNLYRQFNPSMIDPGKMDVVMAFSDAGYAAARALIGVKSTYKLLFRSGAKVVVDGWVSVSLQTENEHGAMVCNCNFRWSGKPKFTPAS